MAAGRGTRISKHIGDIPKSMIDLGGTTLISHTIDMLHENGINDISIIVGFKHEVIEKELESKGVKIYYNPFYAVTNSLGSLWMAKEEITDEDIIFANADVFWESGLLYQLLDDKRKIVMLSDVKRVDDGDYFFNTDDNGRITAYGKELSRDDRNCEYVGIAQVKKEFIPTFKNQLEKMIDAGEYQKWWENVLYSLTDTEEIFAADVNDKFWAEVDFIEDYCRIKNYISAKNERKNI